MTEYWYTLSSATASLPYDQFSNSGGANKNASLMAGGGRSGPPTHDDATTYVLGNWAGALTNQCANVDWPSPMAVPPSASSTFTMGLRWAGGGNPNLRTYIYWTIAGPTSGTAIATDVTSDASWRTIAPSTCADPTTFRPGGGSWVLGDFDDSTTLFPRIFHDTASGGGNVLYSSIFGQIEYQPPAGGFVFLLGLAGLSALLNVGAMSGYDQFDRFLKWRHDFHPRHTEMSVSEKQTAWDEYKSYKHPSFYY